MHDQARHGFARMLRAAELTPDGWEVLDLGGSDVTVADLLPGCRVDLLHADPRTFRPDRKWSLVISTGMFEHCRNWQDAVATAADCLEPGGHFLVTASGPGRSHHGQHGALFPAVGEHYANVWPDILAATLARNFAAFGVEFDSDACAVYAWARR